MAAVPPDLIPWACAAVRLPESAVRVVPVAGDASARRYFRLANGGNTWMLADSPPASQKNAAFLAIRDLLAQSGIRVPSLLAADLDRGYLLLEDFGDELLLPALNEQSADRAYNPAFHLLQQLATIPVSGLDLPAYDAPLLSEELGRFGEWFVAALLGYALSGGEREIIAGLEQLLIASALEQPRVLVHRDFHSRNLMQLPGGELGVIDFQDAVLGPVTYDPVSLLRDCYIRWPRQRVLAWALAHRERLVDSGLLSGVDEARFLRWFDWMGLQRHIKVLGTFARLHLRDGKPGYLQDLPLVVAYVEEMLAAYAGSGPAFRAFADWFTGELRPRIHAQPWSRPA